MYNDNDININPNPNPNPNLIKQNSVVMDINMDIGTNGHLQETWSNNLNEKVLQFYYQLVRTDKTGLLELEYVLRNLLLDLTSSVDTSNRNDFESENYLLIILYKLIAQTRDIEIGKGEYTLAYMMIKVWYDFYPEAALFAIKCFVTDDGKERAYGSWKDIKKFCEYCVDSGMSKEHILIQNCLTILTDQIKRDYETVMSGKNNISLAAKWAPREKSSCGWMFETCAKIYFYNISVNNGEFTDKIKKNIYMKYRKILSLLNRHSDTLEIKCCSKLWSSINFNNLTSHHLIKLEKQFFSLNKNMTSDEYMKLENTDILEIQEKNMFMFYLFHATEVFSEKLRNISKNIDLVVCYNYALELIKYKNTLNRDGVGVGLELDDVYNKKYKFINTIWENISNNIIELREILPIVDVSKKEFASSEIFGTREFSLAFAILVAEKSTFGNGIILCGCRSKWVNLQNSINFVDKVELIMNNMKDISDSNDNFYSSFYSIVDLMLESKMTNYEIKNTTLLILSDLQFTYNNTEKDTIYSNMKKICEKDKIPMNNLIFWNTSFNSGFPCKSYINNVTMLSGRNYKMINLFNDRSTTEYRFLNVGLQMNNSWNMFSNIISNKRYKKMGTYLVDLLLGFY